MTKTLLAASAVLLTLFFATYASAQQGPPVSEPVDANVINTPNVIVANESTNPVAVANNERERVYLVTGSGGSFTCINGIGAKRVHPDGSLDSDQFVVPEGKLLVLTDFGIGVRERGDYPWDSKRLIAVEVNAEPSESFVDTVYQTSFPITSDLQEIGEAWVDRTLASGAVVGAGRYLCIKAGFGFDANNRVSMINLTKLYGYLIDQ